MPGQSSADEEPKNQNPKETGEAIPEPSPGVEPKADNSWGKEESTPGAASESAQSKVIEIHNSPTGQERSNQEMTWAVIAHLSVLLNLVTGFLGGVAAIAIYFIYKDRSRFVAYHAMQSFIFQAITWLGGGLVSGILIAVGGAFSFLILPLLCLIPGFLLLLLIPISLIFGVIGAVQVSNSGDFRYWVVGDWVRDILEPERK